MKGLTLHLKYIHSMTPKQYCELFPGSKMFSKEVMDGETFGGKTLKGKKIGPHSEAHIQKLKNAPRKKGWKHKPETIQKMKENWVENYEARCKSIKEMSSCPKYREKKSISTKNRIEKHGFHLRRGKSSKLEIIIQKILEENNIQFKREYRSSVKILDTYRYFDFFLKDQRILIEVDGEFWHQREDRLRIDAEKTQYALEHGYSFLRLSDKFSKDILENPKLLIHLITSKNLHEDHTQMVINSRLAEVKNKKISKK